MRGYCDYNARSPSATQHDVIDPPEDWEDSYLVVEAIEEADRIEFFKEWEWWNERSTVPQTR